MKVFFTSEERRSHPLKINGLDKLLEIQYVSETEDDEYLMRLLDLEQPEETLILRENYPLTGRESEVLLWISRGKTNREIATVLAMSPRTVNKHLEQVFKKLGVENRTSAAAMALKFLNA